MSKKVHRVAEPPSSNYGVCCSAKDACPLSYESDEFIRIAQLLQAPDDATSLKAPTFQTKIASLTRFFQHNTATCSACHRPVVNAATLAPSSGIDSKRLQRVLRLRNQLVGLEILRA
jgi:hypothetical protein